MKNEKYRIQLQNNNLDIDSDSDDGKMSLIDEYKEKNEKLRKELEKKNQEL